MNAQMRFAKASTRWSRCCQIHHQGGMDEEGFRQEARLYDQAVEELRQDTRARIAEMTATLEQAKSLQLVSADTAAGHVPPAVFDLY